MAQPASLAHARNKLYYSDASSGMEPEQPTPTTHRVTTIEQLAACATMANLPDLLVDLQHFLLMTLDPRWGPKLRRPHTFVWVEDGRHDILPHFTVVHTAPPVNEAAPDGEVASEESRDETLYVYNNDDA